MRQVKATHITRASIVSADFVLQYEFNSRKFSVITRGSFFSFFLINPSASVVEPNADVTNMIFLVLRFRSRGSRYFVKALGATEFTHNSLW